MLEDTQRPRSPSGPGCRAAERWLLGVGLALSACAQRHELRTVECVIDYGGQSHQALARATTDPYRVAPIKIEDAFEFKAVYVPAPAAEATLDFYVYDQTDRGPVLLEQTKFRPPFPENAARNGTLTGSHHVYAGGGEELVYACRWLPE